MRVAFRQSFERDLKKLKADRAMRQRIREMIEEVEAAGRLEEVTSLKKLSGGGAYYRIRVGDYRIGLEVEGGNVTFVRCLHRRDIYRYFP